MQENKLKKIKEKSYKICEIKESEEEAKKKVEEFFKKKSEENYRVWFLMGKEINSEEEIVLQVAQKKEPGTKEEIIRNIEFMFNEKYTVIGKDEKDLAESNKTASGYSYFYIKNLKLQSLYRQIKEKYKNLVFYELDIDKYLSYYDKSNNIYQVSKDYIAESKLAFETNAKYWNYYRSGIGKRIYSDIKGENKFKF